MADLFAVAVQLAEPAEALAWEPGVVTPDDVALYVLGTRCFLPNSAAIPVKHLQAFVALATEGMDQVRARL
jgi:hypothetical protein